MTINGKTITKDSFLYDGTRFHICNQDEIPLFALKQFVTYHPISELKEMYERCNNPFKFIYDFKTLETIVDQVETAVFAQ